jgi:hypothetical protein
MTPPRAYPSLEVRWFVDGELDPSGEVSRAFRAWRPSAGGSGRDLEWPDEARVDTYLIVPHREDLGLKRRVERPGSGEPAPLEFKGRTAVLGDPEIVPGLRGRVEKWTKWSSASPDLVLALAPLFERDGPLRRIAVRKRRLLRTFQLPGNGEALEVPDPATRIPRGVGVELTRIRVGGRPAWTLGLEAFPETVAVGELMEVSRSLLADESIAAALHGATSCGYPAWLSALPLPT